MLIYVVALGVLAAGGCSQTGYGYRAQTATLPEAGADYVSEPNYLPRYSYSGNPAINSWAQERLYSHPE